MRRRPAHPRRILIAHHLLLGDTLLLTPLVAKLREQYPDAQIVLACPKAIAPLYASKPFGVEAFAFDPRDGASVKRLLVSGPYDLGIVAGDNRHSWLALGAGCRWIVAHAGDAPAWKNWPVDEPVPYPDAPAAWADFAAALVEGPAPRLYRSSDWPAPQARAPLPAALRDRPYVVLHPGRARQSSAGLRHAGSSSRAASRRKAICPSGAAGRAKSNSWPRSPPIPRSRILRAGSASPIYGTCSRALRRSCAPIPALRISRVSSVCRPSRCSAPATPVSTARAAIGRTRRSSR
ncbi:putative aDP-heptose--lipooligosaccharide heptosyltransferase II [Burkholderia thailandensis]|uniref:ADP-heptose--lipooligosaccharide heptosyltransferase II n=1 Tax=Burkholderia thailandensis TaxID=57975 RepID=A0AAW9D1F3_BURTH|nr:putative aDP-heptose--lipooligosaccharide heptosyltransferase II [Burkholderia thailandensis]